MWLSKVYKRAQHILYCRIEESKIFPWTYSDKSLFRILLSFKGCIRIYINDAKVPKRDTYVCSQYKDSGTVKVKVWGLFNYKTIFLPINTELDFEELYVNFTSFNKVKIISNNRKEYCPKIYTLNQFADIRIYKCKKPILHKSYLEFLKSRKQFSLNRKQHQLTNLTN